MSESGIATEASVGEVPTPKKAAVIDDAFDDVMPGEVTFTQCQEFYELVNESGVFDTLLKKLNIDVPAFGDWPSKSDNSEDLLKFLKQLWDKREDGELSKLIKDGNVFSKKLEKLADLDRVCKNLAAHSIEVQTFPSTIQDLTVFEKEEFLYVFIDYNLGTQDGDAAIKNAKDVAKSIYEKSAAGKQKPVTVLMSAKQVSDGDKTQFQKDAGMLEGVFRFSSKEDLINERKVSLLIRAYREEFQSNHALQDYIQALIAAAKKAQTAFEEDVKVLRIEDYEYIHDSVLQNNKQPLGDYLAWLYGAHWSNLLLRNEQLNSKQKVIDSVISNKPPVHHSPPSEKIAEMFMNALFEQNLEAISAHPMNGKKPAAEEKVDEKANSKSSLPFLHLGDIFSKAGEKQVLMVLNPQCDLERPSEKMVDRSIFLVPGLLVPIDEPPDPNAEKTEFFVFEETHYRIIWNLKNVISIPLGRFERFMSIKGCERKYRLRLPYALDIQQRFTSNISRVGLPVSPPLTKYVALQVEYKDTGGEPSTLIGRDKNDGYAFLPKIQTTNKEIRLTLKFALDFKGTIIDQYKLLEEQLAAAQEPKPKLLIKRVEKVGAFIDNFDDWFFKNSNTLKMPKDGKVVTLVNDVLSIGLNSNIKDAETPFLINLRTKQENDTDTELVVDDTASEESTDQVAAEVKQ